MEIASPNQQQQQQKLVGKKLWNIIRIVFFMLRKGIIAKSNKATFEFPVFLKRSKKALSNTLHHRSQQDDVVLSRPRDYEFSCSNSPAFFPSHVIKRNSNNKKHQHCHHAPRFPRVASHDQAPQYDDVSSAVHKVLEMLNNGENSKKQIRITDSPFPLKDEGDSEVDVAAEEFIKRFYRDLNLQRNLASSESPYPYSWDRS